MPQYSERAFAIFVNRYCEIAWMAHRLLPLMQPPDAPLSAPWKEKWRLLDDSFEYAVHSLKEELGKNIGAAMVELVKAKFPFNADTAFPL